MQGDFDAVGMAGTGLIDAVIDHFLYQMVRSGGVGVHARPFTDGIQTGQDFNVRCIVSTVQL